MELKQIKSEFLTLSNYSPRAATINDLYAPHHRYTIIKLERYIKHEARRLTTKEKEKLLFIYYNTIKQIALEQKYGLTVEAAENIAKNITLNYINKNVIFVFAGSLNNIFYENKQLFYKFTTKKMLDFLEIPPEKQYLFLYTARIKAARNISRYFDRLIKEEALKFNIFAGMIDGRSYKELEPYASKPTIIKIWQEFINDADNYSGGNYHHKAIFKKIIADDTNAKYKELREKNIKNNKKEALKMQTKREKTPAQLKAARNKKIIKDYNNGKTPAELAKKYNLDLSNIFKIIRAGANTTPAAERAAAREAALQQALILLAEGKTQKEAAAELDISPRTLANYLKKYKEALTNE